MPVDTMHSRLFSAARTLAGVAALAGLAGCYDEGLAIHDLVGTIEIPGEAGTFTFVRPVLDDNGDPVLDPATGDPQTESETLTDVRLLGPVYIGLYASVREDNWRHPHPETGPPLGDEPVGDAFPYGGTTLGDLRQACFEHFQCRMVSGRYESFEAIIDWWNNVLGEPIRDAKDEIVDNAQYFEQTCYQLYRVTSPEEVRITATSDRNGDGAVDANDLDFVYDEADDVFRGEFIVPQADFYENMTAWAFMESPSPGEFGNFSYNSTCNPQLGYQEFTYNQQWRAGTQFNDVLNRPFAYTETGDWISSTGFTWTDDPFEPADIALDYEVE